VWIVLVCVVKYKQKGIGIVMKEYISIKELIRMVQTELMESQRERTRDGQPILFETSELEIELNTVLSEDADGACTIGIPLLKSEISSKYNEQHSQKIKLKFKVSHSEDFVSDVETEDFLPPRGERRISGRYPRLNVEVMDYGEEQ